MKGTLAFILGTRPEIIKLSPVIRSAKRRRIPFFIIHTNQHYSPELDRVFFKELGIAKAKYNLRAGGGTNSEQIGKMLPKIERILVAERPGAVIVQGDTNSVFAGAFAARRAGIPVAHVEAGLRSYDIRMPEETNRVLTDHISEFLFAPTANSKNILLSEGISAGKIFVTGNTVVDALHENLKIAEKKSAVLSHFDLRQNGYFLLTLHRGENVDSRKVLRDIFRALGEISRLHKTPVLFPVHPRTARRIKEFRINLPEGVRATPPVGYFDFLVLEKNARLILTDSGGIQEEACALHIPCVTLRKNTERPETLDAGANMLGGVSAPGMRRAVSAMLRKPKKWRVPFGNGKAGEKIVGILSKKA